MSDSSFSNSKDTLLVVIAGSVTALVGAAWLYSNVSSNKRSKKHPWPVVKGNLPIVGHSMHLVNQPGFQKRLESWADEYGRDHGIFEVNPGPTMPNFLVLCKEEPAFEINGKRPFIVTRAPHVNEVARSVGVTGLFSAEGDDWRQQQRLVTPALNRKSVQDYMSVFRERSAKVIAKWQQAASGGNIITGVEHDLSRSLADSFSNVAMERDFDFLNHPTSNIAKDVEAALSGSNFRSFMPLPYWQIPIIGQYLDGVGWSIRRLEKLMNTVLDELEQQSKTTSTTTTTTSGKQQQKRSFIRKLFDTMKSEKTQLSRDIVVGNMMTLFIGGTDSTAKSIASGLYHLATDPDLFQELKLEASMIDFDTVTLDELFEKVPKIKSFLHEQHRCFGVPMQLVEASEDITLMGTRLPKGTQFMILLQYITTNVHEPTPDVPLGPKGETPDVFCARRWIQKDPKTGQLSTPTPEGHGVLGFGHGVRRCPGRVYSEAISMLIVLRLLQTFQAMELKDPADSFYKIYDVVTRYHKSIELKLTL